MVMTNGMQMTPPTDAALMIFKANGFADIVASKANNVIFRDQEITRTKGYETIEFDIAISDSSYASILPERLVKFGARWFRIKLIEESRYQANSVHVTCYAKWYDMGECPEVTLNYGSTTLGEVLSYISSASNVTIIPGSGVAAKAIGGLTVKANSPLYLLRYLCKVFGLVLVFGYDDKGNVICIPQYLTMQRLNFPLAAGKHISGIKRTVDSRSLCTRYTLIGENGVTAAAANGGLAYLEKYDWFDAQGLPRRVIPITKEDTRYTLADNMLESMSSYLDTYSSPIVTYAVNALIYSTIPEIYQYQLILDEDLNLTEWRKVSSREINYSSISKSSIVFDDPRQTIIDSLNSDED